MTHADLVARAASWLRNTRSCGVVLTEHVAGSEIPDAIGWKGPFSYLIECKVSRSDFLADLHKPTRRVYAERPAFRCYYMTPQGLLWAFDDQRRPRLFRELPAGWGLLEVPPQPKANVRMSVRAQPFEDLDDRTPEQLRREVYRLYCDLRRYQAQGLRYRSLNEIEADKKAAVGVPPGAPLAVGAGQTGKTMTTTGWCAVSQDS